MQRLWLLMLLGLAAFCQITDAVPPTILSATYDIVETNLQGMQATHALFNYTTDQEIYYLNDPVCGCQQNMSECQNRWVPNSIVVNETGYNITTLTKDQWYDFEFVPHDTINYFKLYLGPTPGSSACPILKLEHNLNIGDANMAVSNRFIPTLTNFQYIKYRWARDALWVCPQKVEWGYGWWYLTITPDTPRVENLSYRLRWSTKDVDVCLPPPPRIASPKAGDDWTLLEDNIPHIDWFPPRVFKCFRYYVNAPCTDFGVSARPVTPYYATSLADFDLFVSTTDPFPQTMKGGRNTFASDTEHDDYLTFKNVCNPTGAPTSVFYICLWNWQGDGITGSIVATSQSANWSRSPLIQNGPLEMAYTLANDFGQLHCGPVVNGARERFRSVYPSYPYSKPGDQWGAQNPMYPYPPSNDKRRVNHMWPIIKHDMDFFYLNALNWTSHPNYTVNQPRTLTLAMNLYTRKPGSVQYYVNSEPHTCDLQLHGVLVNADGEPLTGNPPLTRRQFPCDRAAFARVRDEARALIDSMVTMTNYADLQMAQTQLEFLKYSDEWRGCREKMLSDLFSFANTTVDFPDTARCMEYPDTDAWRADPCCNDRAKLDACCASDLQQIRYEISDNVQHTNVDSQCGISQCARQRFDNYVRDATMIQDASIGCSAAFDANAGPTVIAASTDFYKQCRQKILGDRLEGIACSFDADCVIPDITYLNGTCDLRTFHCSYRDSDVLLCWARTIDPLIARSLFDLWRISDNVNETRLLSELTARFVTPTCTGPTGIRYRENHNFASEYTTCYDLCYNPSIGLDIQPYCFENDPTYCPIPVECSTWILPYNWCWRQFFHRSAQSESVCVAEKACNWLPCTSATDSTCEANCTDTRISASVCIECTREGGCVGLPNVTRTACVNSTVTGSCSVLCNGLPCPDKPSCEAAGLCMGKESAYAPLTIFEHYNRSGLCFSPFITDFLGNAYCGGARAFDWPEGSLVSPECHYGCVCSNDYWSHPACNLSTSQSECTSNGFLWVKDDMARVDCEASPARCFTSWQAPTLSPSGVYNLKSQSECTSCAGEIYQTVNQWQKGVWTPAEPVTRFWTTKQFAPINTWSPSIDYIGFGNEVARAIVARVALAYSTEALCRNGAELDALDAYTCDCSTGERAGDGDDECYPQVTSRAFAVDRACPYLTSVFDHSQVTVTIPDKAFPPEAFCQNLYLALYPAASFQSQIKNKLSSEIFLSRSLNPYVVVRNKDARIVGQIVTNGINVTWDSKTTLGAPLTLCIPIEETISRDANLYPRVAFGKLRDGVVGIAHIGDARQSTNFICFDVEDPGIYFGTATVQDVSDPVDLTFRGMATSSMIFYGLIIVATLFQIGRYVLRKHYKKTTIPLFKPIQLAIILLFGILRAIYMGYTAVNASTSDSATDSMMVIYESASILFFLMTMGIFYIWFTIVKNVRELNGAKKTPIPYSYWAVAVVFLVELVVIISVFYGVSEAMPPPCLSATLASPRPNHERANVAHITLLAIASVAVAIVYTVMGIIFIRTTRGHPAVMRATLSVLTTFVPMLVIKSVLTLWSALTEGVVPVLVFTGLEIIPASVLLYFILPFSKRSKDSVSMGRKSTPTDKTPSTTTTTRTTSQTSVIAPENKGSFEKSANHTVNIDMSTSHRAADSTSESTAMNKSGDNDTTTSVDAVDVIDNS